MDSIYRLAGSILGSFGLFVLILIVFNALAYGPPETDRDFYVVTFYLLVSISFFLANISLHKSTED